DHVTAGLKHSGEGLQPSGPPVAAGLPIRSGQVPPAATGVEKGARLPDASGEFPGGAPDEPIRVAIIGRPNVGKSTLLNRLLNQERSIVTPLPGTTRDAVDAELERDGRRYRIVDTACIRRKGKTKLLAIVATVAAARSKRISAGELAAFVQAVDFDRATTPAGRPSRVSRLVQVSSAPPAFLAFTDRPGPLHFAFERFLENRLRERFVFQGTPIIIKAKASK